jgi:hypothetical protein
MMWEIEIYKYFINCDLCQGHKYLNICLAPPMTRRVFCRSADCLQYIEPRCTISTLVQLPVQKAAGDALIQALVGGACKQDELLLTKQIPDCKSRTLPNNIMPVSGGVARKLLVLNFVVANVVTRVGQSAIGDTRRVHSL